MKLFITGASGFIGGAITQRLSPHHQVKAMARSASSAEKVESLGAEAVSCDLLTITEGDLQGCDLVIHAAARAEEWGSYADFYQANVVGTRRMLEAAQGAGVKRFIHLGTEAALFRGQTMRQIDETTPYAFESPFPYSKTKALAEHAVLAAASATFHTLSLRPRLVWGPGDQTIVPAIKEMVAQGTFAWIDQGKVLSSTTYIDNLVAAVELALTEGGSGQAYFVCDEGEVNLRAFLTELLATEGISLPQKSFPSWLLKPLAHIVDRVWQVASIERKPPITRMAVAMMSRDCTLVCDKAKRDLGYAPIVSREEGLATLHRLFSGGDA